ncbi:hypothetical protein UCRPC4_g01416 [Phaeomoniella chlamydospora]|uniref:Uncharacterized protein n=1 Tax=Phaeomoniella chlamydospora TaxID=158046 RepID=A0A0G2HDY2_PHACM|nr:hypothetical protein UCRPC4_g01416 [Phaeomoniella chlamydospora]
MKATSILGIKSWLSKLHPPLPRTARESQQLLSVLTSSFQKQLDEAHPPIERRGRAHSTPPPPTHSSTDSLRKIETLIASPDAKTRLSNAFDAFDLSASSSSSIYYSKAIERGENDVESLVRFLNTKLSEGIARKDNPPDSISTGKIIGIWFDTANWSSRTTVLRSKNILHALADILRPATLGKVLWAHVEKYVVESPHIVTIEEAEAISISMTALITNTPRSAMHHSANSFSSIVSIFEHRGYKVHSPEEKLGKAALTFHPLAQPAGRLVQFIMQHPENHNIDAQHFDTLLRISELWDSVPLLRKAYVHALHPKRPDPAYVTRALSVPEIRVAYSSRLQVIQQSRPRYSPLGLLHHVHQQLRRIGRDRDAELVQAFLLAHNNGHNVSDLSVSLEKVKEEAKFYEAIDVHGLALT